MNVILTMNVLLDNNNFNIIQTGTDLIIITCILCILSLSGNKIYKISKDRILNKS